MLLCIPLELSQLSIKPVCSPCYEKKRMYMSCFARFGIQFFQGHIRMLLLINLYNAVKIRIAPCCAMLRCAVLCHATLCRAVLCCLILQCFLVVLCCAVPCRAVPCRAVPCRAVPCCAVLLNGSIRLCLSTVLSDSTWTAAGPSMVVTHYAWNAEVPSMHWKWNKHAFKRQAALAANLFCTLVSLRDCITSLG